MRWSTPEDGIVITKKMGEFEVYTRCRIFGAERLIEALEIFLEEIKEIA